MSLYWDSLDITGEPPCPRSGHSFTAIADAGFLLFGGCGRRDGGVCVRSSHECRAPSLILVLPFVHLHSTHNRAAKNCRKSEGVQWLVRAGQQRAPAIHMESDGSCKSPSSTSTSLCHCGGYMLNLDESVL